MGYRFTLDEMKTLIELRRDFDIAIAMRDWNGVQKAAKGLDALYAKLDTAPKLSSVMMGAAQ